ncbi:GAP family protein [Streptomyces sp. NPDC012623]|uniref:GAP family protein n=1 Tax=unclassified Streptomyces TaxID=2593676 RepID=UPI0036B52631
MGDVLVEVLPLALLDALGVSTIAIPVWFLLMPSGLRIGRVFGYLVLITVGYLLLGLLLLSTLAAVRDDLRSALESPVGDKAMAVAGVALILLALWYGMVRTEKPGSGRLSRWREQAVGRSATVRGLTTVALLAVLLEVATMFPYLAAIGTLSSSGLGWPSQAGVLAVYCVVMVVPAALVTVARLISGRLVHSPLRRIDRWLRDGAQENTAWLFALAGFMILSNTTLYESIMDHLSSD